MLAIVLMHATMPEQDRKVVARRAGGAATRPSREEVFTVYKRDSRCEGCRASVSEEAGEQEEKGSFPIYSK